MGVKRRQNIVVFVTILMLGLSVLPQAGSSPSGEMGPDEGFIGGGEDPVWTDPLDDLSHVYMPAAGLQGIEVSGGDAHLKAGSDTGWLASEIITSPADFRYDLVQLEVPDSA